MGKKEQSMKKERIHISVDPDIRKMIENQAQENQRNVSDEIASIIVNRTEGASENQGEKISALLAIARKNERELRIIKGMLNSMFVAMTSLQDAEYVNPETKKHPIITGAEKEELYRLREESAKRARMKELES